MLADSIARMIEEMLNESFKGVHSRDIVKGTVVLVTETEIVFNIGYKCDGTMTKDEFGGTDAPLCEQVKEGDEMDVMVVMVGERWRFGSGDTGYLGNHRLSQGNPYDGTACSPAHSPGPLFR